MRTLAFITSLILVFSIPWENIVTISGFGTLTRSIGIVTAIIWLCSVFTVRSFRKLHLFHMLLITFIFWNVATAFWSINVEETIYRIKTYIQLAFMVFIFWDLYTTDRSLRASMQAYIFGGYISIIFTFYDSIFNQGPDVRYAATGFNPNDLSLLLVLGIPLAWHLSVTNWSLHKSKVLLLINLMYIPTAMVAIFLTASRGSFLATVPAIIFIILSLRRIRLVYRFIIPLFIVLLFLIMRPFIPQHSIDRLMTIDNSISTLDLGGRTFIWENTIHHFEEHPLLGVGSGVMSAHNVFLSVITETGMIGLILFGIVIFIPLYLSFLTAKRFDSLYLCLFFVWFVGALVHSWEDRKATWLILSFIVIGCGIMIKNEDSINHKKYIYYGKCNNIHEKRQIKIHKYN